MLVLVEQSFPLGYKGLKYCRLIVNQHGSLLSNDMQLVGFFKVMITI